MHNFMLLARKGQLYGNNLRIMQVTKTGSRKKEVE